MAVSALQSCYFQAFHSERIDIKKRRSDIKLGVITIIAGMPTANFGIRLLCTNFERRK